LLSVARTAIGKAYRGAFNDTEAPVLGGHVIREQSSAPASIQKTWTM